jgi:hypothetical protein
MIHGRGGLYPEEPDTWHTPEPVLQFSRIRRYRRPSLWRRILWWLSLHDTLICYSVLIAFSVFLALHIADAARAGRLPIGW